VLGALLAFAGAALALALVREHDVEREPLEPDPEQESVPGKFGAQRRAIITE
jgi:hypothetical protein